MYFTAKRLKLYLSALAVLPIFTCLGFRSSILSGSIDFRSYYAAGYMLRTGHASLLYNYFAEQLAQNAVVVPAPTALPFFAPPFTAVPFVPLSFAPYLWALFIFGLINIALLALAVRIMRPYLGALSVRWPPAPVLLFASFFPVSLTIVMGQLSILILLIDCLTFALLETGSPFLAGLIFSLALMKFQTAIPAALLFLLWRRWRFIGGFLAGSVTLGIVSVWIIGLRGLAPYVSAITHLSSMAGTALQVAVGVAPRRMANLYGLFFVITRNHAPTLLTLAASALLIVWAVRRRPSLPLALMVATLVSYHFYPCDLTLLLLPLSLLCNRLFAEDDLHIASRSESKFERYRRTILLCSIGTFLISPILIEIISCNLIFLLALPILGLTLCPLDWSTVTIDAAEKTRAAEVQHSLA